MSKKRIRVGFIGTGGIARFHADILSEMEDVEIVAGCDIDRQSLSKFAETYEVAHTFEDHKELVQLDQVDAVSVCSPNYVHRDHTVAALLAGKDVMVEKPMAMNAREAEEMIAAAEQTGKTLVIGFQFRLGPEAQTLKHFIDGGELGKIVFARCQALRRRGIPSWGVFGRKDLQGGGPLIDIGVHMIEVAHYLMGSPRPVAASASAYTYLGDKPLEADAPWGPWDYETYTVEDLGVGFVRFENGACMSVETSFAAHIEKDVLNFQLMGEKGGCIFMPPQVFKDQAGSMVNITPAHIPEYKAFNRKMERWIACLRGEEETQAPAEAGLAVQRILDALYESAEKGAEVRIG